MTKLEEFKPLKPSFYIRYLIYKHNHLKDYDNAIRSPKEKNEAVERFANEIGLTYQTMYKHLQTDENHGQKLRVEGKYKNKLFKDAISEALGRPYEEIWCDHITQFKIFIRDIYADPHTYTSSEEGRKILERLKAQAVEYGLKRELAIVCNAISIYEFYKGNSVMAIDILMTAANIIRHQNCHDVLSKIYCNIGIYYYYNLDLENAFSYLGKAFRIKRDYPEAVENQVAYNIHFTLGLCHLEKQYGVFSLTCDRAINELKEALKYTDGDKQLQAPIYLSIGNCYMNIKDYIESKKYYFMASELYGNDDLKQSIIVNNCAFVHLRQGFLNEAEKEIDKALSMVKNKYIDRELLYTFTKIELGIAKRKFYATDFEFCLNNFDSRTPKKPDLVRSIKSLIKKTIDIEIIVEIKKVLLNMLKTLPQNDILFTLIAQCYSIAAIQEDKIIKKELRTK